MPTVFPYPRWGSHLRIKNGLGIILIQVYELTDFLKVFMSIGQFVSPNFNPL